MRSSKMKELYNRLPLELQNITGGNLSGFHKKSLSAMASCLAQTQHGTDPGFEKRRDLNSPSDDREREEQERPQRPDHGSWINTPLNTFDIRDDILRRFILLPTFQGDGAAEVLFLRPLLFLESVLYFLTPTILPINDIWEHRIAHHNKVYGVTECK